MNYYPICLDITSRNCIVIGGGKVAARKAQGLLDHQAKVTMISPELGEESATLHAKKQLTWINRPYQEGDLTGAFLVIAATDDPEVQERVHAEAEKNNILLNVADVPKWCNFILPATVRRGDLNVAISTGGKSPALAKRMRKGMENQFGAEYEVLLETLGALRPLVLDLKLAHSENKRIFEELLHDDMVIWIRDNQWDKVTNHLQNVLGDQVPLDCLADIQAQCAHPSAGSIDYE
ncbi:MAG: bifunctional precorrin-2 dehydrogenase/sirohydrochlorin ferrochelatase [Desulfobulbaceae bacterium]|nr:bifunctional precorrin-2 dehydrogenase/sirohydrochlorin ferrochelatase [Desulfobulbaceae bacterium]